MSTSNKPKQTKSWPFPTFEAFRDKHLKAALEVDRYLHFARKGKQTLDHFQLRELKRESSPYWLANNAHSRIAFMEIVERRFTELTESKLPSKPPMAMVTLLFKEFVIPIGEAETYDTTELKRWTRRALTGFDYIGMVEAALIGNVRRSPEGKPEWVVHFHTHCFVWGFNRTELANREAEINERFEEWCPGITVMKVTPTSSENCLKRLRYIFKGQLHGHKISPERAEEVAGRSGVPVRRETGSFIFYRYSLRPAESPFGKSAVGIPALAGMWFTLWMWTREHRSRMAEIARKTKRYPSDLTDEEWARIAPLMPKPGRRGRPREVEFREVLNAVRYLVRSGGGWRMLPVHFGHWRTVYGWFRELARRFLFQTIHDVELMLDRERAGREASPSAVVIDSQSVKAPHAETRGYDANKKIVGRKRHIAVDTDGRLLMVTLTPANISDSAGAQMILDAIRKRWPWVRHLFADAAYDRLKLMDKAAYLEFALEIIRRRDGAKGFEVLPRRWVVERTFGWMIRWRRLVRDYERRIDVSTAMILVAMGGNLIRRNAHP